MRKVAMYSVIFVLSGCSGILYWAAMHEPFFRRLENSGFITDMYQYGDLYTSTHLPSFREAAAIDTLIPLFTPTEKDTQLSLYLEGDSYTQLSRMSAAQVRAGTYQYQFNSRADTLNRSKKNILIVERTERYFRLHVQDAKQKKNRPPMQALENFLLQNPQPDWFNTKQINDRLQYLMGNNRFGNMIQELKAQLNYSLFGITGQTVVVSERHHQVYLAETLNPGSLLSPYCPLTTQESEDIIEYLNDLYDEKKSYGFDAVYFSLIPDKIRVYPIGSDSLNTLFQLMKNPRLRMPILSCEDTLMQAREPIFICSDTHWNRLGLNRWLALLDQLLKKQTMLSVPAR